MLGSMQLIGDKLSENGGVAIAEELAPYLGFEIDKVKLESHGVSDEGFILPILQRFQGRPQVDEVCTIQGSSNAGLVICFQKMCYL